MKTEQKLLLTQEEVAYMLGISTKSVDEWRNIPGMNFPDALRIGCRLRFSRTDIEGWIASLPRIKGTQAGYRNSYSYDPTAQCEREHEFPAGRKHEA